MFNKILASIHFLLKIYIPVITSNYREAMILQLTLHAKEKMDAEGIDEEQIKTAIERGSISRQTDGYLATYTYFSVAYKKRGEIYRVKTVFTTKDR